MMILKSKVKLKIKSVQRWMNTLQIFLKDSVMPSLKDLKNRIESVKTLEKSQAMQMVAAAKLRRAQDSAEAARPYTERFNSVLGALASANNKDSGGPQLLVGTGKDQTHLLIVMTAERGLCGGFNSNIAKLAKTHALKLVEQGKTVKIITVGKKGRDVIKRDLSEHFVDHVDLSEIKTVRYTDAQGISKSILDRFTLGSLT